jgi:hypothetical protein
VGKNQNGSAFGEKINSDHFFSDENFFCSPGDLLGCAKKFRTARKNFPGCPKKFPGLSEKFRPKRPQPNSVRTLTKKSSNCEDGAKTKATIRVAKKNSRSNTEQKKHRRSNTQLDKLALVRRSRRGG